MNKKLDQFLATRRRVIRDSAWATSMLELRHGAQTPLSTLLDDLHQKKLNQMLTYSKK